MSKGDQVGRTGSQGERKRGGGGVSRKTAGADGHTSPRQYEEEQRKGDRRGGGLTRQRGRRSHPSLCLSLSRSRSLPLPLSLSPFLSLGHAFLVSDGPFRVIFAETVPCRSGAICSTPPPCSRLSVAIMCPRDRASAHQLFGGNFFSWHQGVLDWSGDEEDETAPDSDNRDAQDWFDRALLDGKRCNERTSRCAGR
jgi:hypothetical protein